MSSQQLQLRSLPKDLEGLKFSVYGQEDAVAISALQSRGATLVKSDRVEISSEVAQFFRKAYEWSGLAPPSELSSESPYFYAVDPSSVQIIIVSRKYIKENGWGCLLNFSDLKASSDARLPPYSCKCRFLEYSSPSDFILTPQTAGHAAPPPVGDLPPSLARLEVFPGSSGTIFMDAPFLFSHVRSVASGGLSDEASVPVEDQQLDLSAIAERFRLKDVSPDALSNFANMFGRALVDSNPMDLLSTFLHVHHVHQWLARLPYPTPESFGDALRRLVADLASSSGGEGMIDEDLAETFVTYTEEGARDLISAFLLKPVKPAELTINVPYVPLSPLRKVATFYTADGAMGLAYVSPSLPQFEKSLHDSFKLAYVTRKKKNNFLFLVDDFSNYVAHILDPATKTIQSDPIKINERLRGVVLCVGEIQLTDVTGFHSAFGVSKFLTASPDQKMFTESKPEKPVEAEKKAEERPLAAAPSPSKPAESHTPVVEHAPAPVATSVPAAVVEQNQQPPTPAPADSKAAVPPPPPPAAVEHFQPPFIPPPPPPPQYASYGYVDHYGSSVQMYSYATPFYHHMPQAPVQLPTPQLPAQTDTLIPPAQPLPQDVTHLPSKEKESKKGVGKALSAIAARATTNQKSGQRMEINFSEREKEPSKKPEQQEKKSLLVDEDKKEDYSPQEALNEQEAETVSQLPSVLPPPPPPPSETMETHTGQHESNAHVTTTSRASETVVPAAAAAAASTEAGPTLMSVVVHDNEPRRQQEENLEIEVDKESEIEVEDDGMQGPWGGHNSDRPHPLLVERDRYQGDHERLDSDHELEHESEREHRNGERERDRDRERERERSREDGGRGDRGIDRRRSTGDMDSPPRDRRDSGNQGMIQRRRSPGRRQLHLRRSGGGPANNGRLGKRSRSRSRSATPPPPMRNRRSSPIGRRDREKDRTADGQPHTITTDPTPSINCGPFNQDHFMSLPPVRQIREHWEEFARVKSIYLKVNPGRLYVNFYSKEEAQKAVDELRSRPELAKLYNPIRYSLTGPDHSTYQKK